MGPHSLILPLGKGLRGYDDRQWDTGKKKGPTAFMRKRSCVGLVGGFFFCFFLVWGGGWGFWGFFFVFWGFVWVFFFCFFLDVGEVWWLCGVFFFGGFFFFGIWVEGWWGVLIYFFFGGGCYLFYVWCIELVFGLVIGVFGVGMWGVF